MIVRRRANVGKRTPKRRKKNPNSKAARLRERKRLKNKCDKLWSQRIHEKGPCVFIGKEVNGQPHECFGGIQAMHGISRTYEGTRFLLENGFPGCARVHTYYSYRKEEWACWLVGEWGLDKFNAMWKTARALAKHDYSEVLETLKRSDPMAADGTVKCSA